MAEIVRAIWEFFRDRIPAQLWWATGGGAIAIVLFAVFGAEIHFSPFRILWRSSPETAFGWTKVENGQAEFEVRCEHRVRFLLDVNPDAGSGSEGQFVYFYPVTVKSKRLAGSDAGIDPGANNIWVEIKPKGLAVGFQGREVKETIIYKRC